jgi:fluoroquinolone transport system ATP-binding protein
VDGDGTPRDAEFPLDGLADDAGFLALLRQHRIETIHTQETTLENVFIDGTGQELGA